MFIQALLCLQEGWCNVLICLDCVLNFGVVEEGGVVCDRGCGVSI